MLGVLGGMGPMATVDFMTKVLRHTPAACDQDHIPAIICSAADIPDRTSAILGQGPDPLPAMRRALRLLDQGGAQVIAMPCNTAHFWHAALQAETSARILHIVDAVADHLAEASSRTDRVGILATTGTVWAGIYQRGLAKRGVECVVPRQPSQSRIMRAVARVKAGDIADARPILIAEAEALCESGCGAVVMACTEIPLALAGLEGRGASLLVDATDTLASACVKACLEVRADLAIAA